MSPHQITMSTTNAEKIAELLEGYALLLRSSPPDRQFELLKTLGQTGVYEPLRYDLVPGMGYVADEAENQRRALLEQLGDGQ